MGSGIQKDTEGHEGDKRTGGAAAEAPGAGRAGRRAQEKEPGISDCDLFRIIELTFPDLARELDGMDDFRRKDRIVYTVAELMMTCIVERIIGNTSGHQHDRDKYEEPFLENMRRLSGGRMERLPHSDTLKYFLEREDPKHPGKILRKMVRGLIRQKKVYGMRFAAGEKSFFRLAMDGVHYFTSSAPLDHSIHRTHSGGRTEYMLTALQLSLVSPDGVRLPFMVEFIENPEGEYDKQDCELKAAKRLLGRLAEAFPKLPAVLLMDGLYLCEDILLLCRKNRWHYSVTVTDHAPVFKELAEKSMAGGGHGWAGKDPGTGYSREVAWCNNVKYKFGKTEFSLNVIKMDGYTANHEKATLFYATSLFLHEKEDGAIRVLDHVCRARWQIEEQFNMQKHHGLGLEAVTGTRKYAGQNFFLVVQIADLIRTFMLHTDLFRKLQQQANPDTIREVIHRPAMDWYMTLSNLLERLKRSILSCRIGNGDISGWRLSYDTA